MIVLPENVRKTIFSCADNLVTRLYGYNELELDATVLSLESENPLIVSIEGTKVLFTKDIDTQIPAYCDYAVLTKNKPTWRSVQTNTITGLKWLKHPLMNNDQADAIVVSWRGKFHFLSEKTDGNGLRSPQLGALYAFLSEEQNPTDRKIVVMPTGTGKTETMLSMLIANRCRKVLVTVPSDALRSQLAEKFLTLGILKRFGIVDRDCPWPAVAVLCSNMQNISDWQTLMEKSNVIVSTMSLLSKLDDNVKRLFSENISHVFVDEAHHSEAQSWDDFLQTFKKDKITLFTATPFRNDGKKLQGKYIYAFSLKDAQKQGYYKPIDFLPIREYNDKLADKKIAEKAVARLREDIESGHNHILMARCSTKQRAKDVFEYYREYEDLNPVVVYTGVPEKKNIVERIKNKEHRIVVCVNMLGEGFDLPEMKIAAIHDTRQSLPVTLQFIGRFTRTSHDNDLGSASVIVNLANKPIEEELQDLYAKDADWNLLLPRISDEATDDQIDFASFINSFSNADDSIVSLQLLRPALSAYVYEVSTDTWIPSNWTKVFTPENYQYRFETINDNSDTLVLVLGGAQSVDFGNVAGINNVVWGMVIVHWIVTPKYNHLYINTSLGGVDCDALAKVLFDDKVQRITGSQVFRVFGDVKRIAVQNFGGRKFGDISFKSYYGKEVEEGIKETERRELSKNNIFGTGYRNGDKVTIGCSVKGKIWSYMRGDIRMFCKWCKHMGNLIADETISDDIVLKNTLRISAINQLPEVMPLGIDWDTDLYLYPEKRYVFVCDNNGYRLDQISIELIGDTLKPYIDFRIFNEELDASYRITYSGDGESHCHYRVEQLSGCTIGFTVGTKQYASITEYFNTDNNAPVIYFANGGILYANNYVLVEKEILPFDKEKLIALPWAGVDLSKESQDVIPYKTDSIQYYFSNYIKDEFDLLYDDDYCGEIADLIGFKIEAKCIHVHLFHLKYASGGVVSSQIKNFYEVCGQAEKCIKWRVTNKRNDFFEHLFRRETKRNGESTCSRILKGDKDLLEQMSTDTSWKKDLKFHVSIVQPALSKRESPEDILNLLGAVKTYLEDEASVDLNVYCSE